jgi:tetratricopeptide (TPR) repeat protein
VHDAYASAAIQSILEGQPSLRTDVQMPPAREELRMAERLLRQSIEENGPIEARVRLGRVLGRLGKHADAVSVLREVLPQVRDVRLEYFGALFLGSEEGALGHVDQARESLERAAALFPTAQSPWLALAEMLQRTGHRAAALDALRHLQQLPPDPEDREDPWRDYLRSFAADADQQIADMRASVDGKQR